MWEISPTLVRHDVAERTSVDVALAGLKQIAETTASAKVSGAPFEKPITNFYQTDPISRAYVINTQILHQFDTYFSLFRSVTMAQCTRAFVKGENYGLAGSEGLAQASFA